MAISDYLLRRSQSQSQSELNFKSRHRPCGKMEWHSIVETAIYKGAYLPRTLTREF